jgi:hypothetical protein
MFFLIVASAFISPFITQTMHITHVFLYTTALLCFPQTLYIPRPLGHAAGLSR